MVIKALAYRDFIETKSMIAPSQGITVTENDINNALFPFQRNIVEWALQKGRAGIFADCGLGKTPMQLEWAARITQRTNGNVLILTPLAVSYQTIREAEKFGVDARRSSNGKFKKGVVVTNYERLHYFDPADFVGVVCDESSILKSFSGTRRKEITVFMRKIPYRLLCTATAAPNDYTELGTSSEALGYLGYMDMLNRFFRNSKNNSKGGRYYGKSMEWRLKGHAELPFWRWICSWARAFRKPSDLGFSDDGFILKPLTEEAHVVEARALPEGRLFAVHAITLQEQREEVKRTIHERCEKVAELVNHDRPAMIWCHLNEEGRTLKRLIPDAVEVSGADHDDAKEEKLLAFINGEAKKLITKPKIGGWGLNCQHCAHVVYFPSHSFEQYYQAVRRCLRFGQQSPVKADIVMTEGERLVFENLKIKARATDEMFSRLVELMRDGQNIRREDNFTQREVLPAWL